jgi:hypothetical protein
MRNRGAGASAPAISTMLRAHYNMPSADFIAQLRTYVIAMNLGPQVVDQVDRLQDADELQAVHEKEMQETKDDILKAVKAWADESTGPETKKALLAVIENA